MSFSPISWQQFDSNYQTNVSSSTSLINSIDNLETNTGVIIKSLKSPDGSLDESTDKSPNESLDESLDEPENEYVYTGDEFNGVAHGYGNLFWNHGKMGISGTYVGDFKDGLFHGYGTETLTNGISRMGSFINGLQEGYGEIGYPDGTYYKGDIKTGMKHGKGIFYFVNGTIYTGDFENNLRTGEGQYVYPNGVSYNGQVLTGLPSGIGKWKVPNDGSYDIECCNGKWGECIARYPEVNLPSDYKHDRNYDYEYDGEMQNELAHGKGKGIYPNGSMYEGEWKHGQPHGQGKITYGWGGTYIGGVSGGLDTRIGMGEYIHPNGHKYIINPDSVDGAEIVYPDGSKYIGEVTVHNGERSNWVTEPGTSYRDEEVSMTFVPNGYGTRTYADGAIYTGQWKNGLRSGLMSFCNLNKVIGYGYWENDKKSGYGVYIDKDGEVFYGNYVNGHRQGYGVLHIRNGLDYKGICQDGHPYKLRLHESRYSTGTIYEGEFHNGEFQGKGKLIYPSGIEGPGRIYEGQFNINAAHGEGCLTDHDGTIYIGEFSRGSLVPNEYMISYKDGRTYEGDVDPETQLPHGHGIMTEGNYVYQGEFVLGKKHGQGKLQSENQIIYEGIFDNNEFKSNKMDSIESSEPSGSEDFECIV